MDLSVISKDLTFEDFILEAITEKHTDLLFDQLQHKELYTYIPQTSPKTRGDLNKKYSRWSNRKPQDGKEYWLNYAIFDRSKKSYVGTLQGTIEVDGNTYVAYEVFPQFQRNRIATRSLVYLIKFIFDTFKVEKITAHVDSRNTNSFKLLESIGFVRVRFIENADHFDGKPSDEYVYELSAYNKAHQRGQFTA